MCIHKGVNKWLCFKRQIIISSLNGNIVNLRQIYIVRAKYKRLRYPKPALSQTQRTVLSVTINLNQLQVKHREQTYLLQLTQTSCKSNTENRLICYS